jgi:putative ABC transport system permease protein
MVIIKSYIKIFFRNLIKQKGYSFINILGLALGLAGCILVFLWIQDEMSYDKFHSNRDELCLAGQIQNFPNRQVIVEITPPAIGPALKKDYPEIINSARVTSIECGLNLGGTIFYEKVHFADTSFFEMFTFPLVRGDAKTVFSDLSSIVITENIAKKYFAKSDPIGQIIKLDNQHDFKVSGVFKNIPRNSSLKFNYLVPVENIKKWGIGLDGWGAARFYTFVQLQKNLPYQDVSLKISDLFRRYMSKKNIRDVFLHPFSRFHLYSVDGKGGLINYIRIFSIIALFVLFIACINFINLTTARAPTRALEVGIRKVVGANRSNLVKQFLGESVLMIFIAILLAIILVKLMLPMLNTFLGKQLNINLFTNLEGIGVLIAIALLTSLLAGSYPAVFLSAFQPVNIFKQKVEPGSRKGWFRKILVVFQFSISIILLINTTVVYKQLDYIKNKDLGIDKKNIIYISSKGITGEKYQTLKNELLKNSNVLNVTVSSHLPSNIANWSGGWDWGGGEENMKVIIGFAMVGYDFTDTFKIPMTKGRFYSRDFSDDHSVVINEKAEEVMGLNEPVGKRLSFIGRNFIIIGVVKNFHSRSLYHDMQPLVLMFGNSKILRGVMDYRYILIKMNPGNVEDTIKYVESTYNTFNPGYTFESKFLDEDFDDVYDVEKRLGKIFSYSAFLAVLISCLGLMGLAAFMVRQKAGEIAIRKVFGASVPGIISLLSKEFVKLVLVANVLACSLSYFAMNKWLQSFASRTGLSWWIFIGASVFSLGTAILVVSFQTVKVALKNPVDSLKYE